MTPRTVCFVCFALLLGMACAESSDNDSTANAPSTTYSQTIQTSAEGNMLLTMTNPAITTTEQTPIKTLNQGSVSTPATTETYCIFNLSKDHLGLTVTVLTAACFALLLTTLMCTCHVCHMRSLISRLQPRHSRAEQCQFRERSESPYRDGGPTETCVMLSDITTTQEESKENTERVLEDKAETKTEMEQRNVQLPAGGSNGDITQNSEVENKEPNTSESADAGV